MQMSVAEIIGIILGMAGIAIALFLYSFDIRKKLNKMTDDESKTLSQFDSHLIDQHHETLTSLKNTLIAHRDDVTRRLEEIQEKQEGVLSKDQAIQLTDLYLDSVNAHLTLELNRLDQLSLRQLFQDRKSDLIVGTFKQQYEEIVVQRIRRMVRPFKLRGNQSFERFVSEINGDAVRHGFLQFERLLLSDPPLDYNSFALKVTEIMREIGKIGKKRMLERISLLYPD